MTSLRTLAGAALLALAGFSATPAFAQTTIGSSTATNTLNGLSYPSVPVVGQSFVLPTGTSYLQSFTFFLGESFDGADLRFDAAVYELGASAPLFVARTGAVGSSNVRGLDTYTFATPNLLLDASKTYAFLLTATGNVEGATNVFGTTEDPDGVLSGDTYTGGSLLVSFDTPQNAAAISGDADAAFRATFTSSAVTATPEPATLALVGGGLALVGVVARRRRQA